MSFSETYREQVILSRRERARRALFFSRILGILLMLTLAVILRSEPKLRADLMEAAINAAMQITGRAEPRAETPPGVRINRPGSTEDVLQQAREVGKRLSARPVGEADQPSIDINSISN